jgi:small subunit ribosomal protein S20
MLGAPRLPEACVATHKSAIKRARQSLRRRARNRNLRSRMRTAIKEARAAIQGGGEEAGQALKQAESVLRRAASRGLIPKKRASRQVSRLAASAHRQRGAKS